MLTVMLILAVGALISTIMSAMGKCPLWVPVVLLSLYACLQVLPKG